MNDKEKQLREEINQIFNVELSTWNYLFTTKRMKEKVEDLIKRHVKDAVEKINTEIDNLRFDDNHHEGLGDIRITIGHWETIVKEILQERNIKE